VFARPIFLSRGSASICAFAEKIEQDISSRATSNDRRYFNLSAALRNRRALIGCPPPPQRITNHESRITNHESRITNHQSPITNHQSPITNHRSPITMSAAPQEQQQDTATATATAAATSADVSRQSIAADDNLACQWEKCSERCTSAEALFVSWPILLSSGFRVFGFSDWIGLHWVALG
jgi:hypothetical protein